jgi:hypothetical protein
VHPPTVLIDPVTALAQGTPSPGAARAGRVVSVQNGWDLGLGVAGLLCVFVLFVIGACVAVSHWVDERRKQRARRVEIAEYVSMRRARVADPMTQGPIPDMGFTSGRPVPDP